MDSEGARVALNKTFSITDFTSSAAIATFPKSPHLMKLRGDDAYLLETHRRAVNFPSLAIIHARISDLGETMET